MVNYRLKENGEFVIRDYNAARPFASFFPGIAGVFGIPMWVFYVNRGQCIAAAGIRSKDEAIMEFQPANKAYQLTPLHGFRTFLKVGRGARARAYEPFAPLGRARPSLAVQAHELRLVEENADLGLRVEVLYFPVVNAPYAALARELTIRNVSKRPVDIRFLDGLSVVVPYGVNNFFLKEMSRTIEAWMEVEFAAPGVPVFRVTTDPRDSSQVVSVKGAHFYAGFAEGGRCADARVAVDPGLVFKSFSDFTYPVGFFDSRAFAVPHRQQTHNKTPCAFSAGRARLAPGDAARYFSLLGHVSDVANLKRFGIPAVDAAFFEEKRRENRALIGGIMDRMRGVSGLPVFDLYARQTYLDNVLRGGLPQEMAVDGNRRTIYVYSRKHGDLERDYNRFSLSATYFSEGEGNYRDVNQNRRSDVFFCPSLGEKNIRDFIDLIQLDGYNPLVFRGDRWVIAAAALGASPVARLLNEKDLGKIGHLVARPFALGDVLHYIEENKVRLACPLKEFAKLLLDLAQPAVEAAFGEGYWTDHWTYNTDLLESFRGLFPERVRELFLKDRTFTYYDTPVYVRPRSERYVVHHGQVRQYHSLGTDEERAALIQKRARDRHKVRARGSEEAVFHTTLLDKLICLIVNKLASLDPFGVGVEMEADKPNWYDALNGLPGLLGSSVSETFEVKRLILFLKDVLREARCGREEAVELTREVAEFLGRLHGLLDQGLSARAYWDAAQGAKEEYRLGVRPGVTGEYQEISVGKLEDFFEAALKKLDAGLAASRLPAGGGLTTYFANRVTRYETCPQGGGRSEVIPTEFRQERLPLFLEGFVHAMRTEPEKARSLWKAVRRSALYDKKLGMYKVNASLRGESVEIGRAKVFAPGWLENGSVWLHMEYKYLLELLRSGLYKEFYEDFFRTLIPFQDPAVYGRSVLENSSFIVSSDHPDPSLHGAGFVARLSGSTAEFIHMWLLMNAGPRPFFLDDSGQLCLRFRPALAAKFFTSSAGRATVVDPSGTERSFTVPKRAYAFLFLGRTWVLYRNPKKRDTFGPSGVRPARISLFEGEGLVREFQGGTLMAPLAARVRAGGFSRIEIDLE